MKQNTKYRDGIIAIFGGGISLTLIIIFLGIWKYDFHVPFGYSDGDNLSTSIIVKKIMDGQFFENNLLGAPFTALNYDYPFWGDYFNLFVLKIIGLILNDWGMTINTYYLLLFPLTTAIGYYVMRDFNVKPLFSLLGSITYSFLAFRFLRGTAHIFLSNYSMVPAGILVLKWLYFDEQLFQIKGFFSYKKNWISIFILIILSISGIYYAFFMAFLMCVIWVLRIAQASGWKEKQKELISRFIPVMVMILTLFIAMFPTMMKIKELGKNMMEPIRSSIEAEVYGMKITQLFLPNKTYGLKFLEEIYEEYQHAPVPNEGSEYLGIIGIIGFVILIFSLFIRKIEERLEFLKSMNIASILLATVGGLGSLFALLISPQIRGYNRISVYIAFFSILAFIICCDFLYDIAKNTIIKQIYILFLVAFMLLGIYEQSFHYLPQDHQNRIEEYKSDREFIKNIEEIVPENSMIYQLPYLAYPESPPQNNMGDYALARGYLHSKTLRWSYGDQRGRLSDIWNKSIASLPINDMIDQIMFAGFRGIYIDANAYKEEEQNALIAQLQSVLHVQPIYSDNLRLLFFDMQPYIKENEGLYSTDIWEIKQREALCVVDFSKGFYGLETNPTGNWRWCEDRGTLVIHNTSDQDIEFKMDSTVYSGYNKISSMRIEFNGNSKEYSIHDQGTAIQITGTLPPGVTEIYFETDAPIVEAFGDPRSMYMRFVNTKINLYE